MPPTPKPPAKKSAAKKAPASRKAAPRKTTARKTATAKRTVRKPAARKTPVRKSTQRKPATRKASAVRKASVATAPVVREDVTAPTPLPIPKRRGPSANAYAVAAILVVVLLAAAGVTAGALRHSSASRVTPEASRTASTRPNNFSADGFSAFYPKPPQRGAVTINMFGQNVATHIYLAGLEGQSVGVQVLTLPPKTSLSDPNYLLESVARGSALGAGAQSSKTKRLTFLESPAVDMTAKGTNGVVVATRVLLHGRRIYQIIGVGRSGQPAAYGDFLRSFRLT